jgi:hypothetical protein
MLPLLFFSPTQHKSKSKDKPFTGGLASCNSDLNHYQTKRTDYQVQTLATYAESAAEFQQIKL